MLGYNIFPMSQVGNVLPHHQEGLIPGFYIPPVASPEPRHISEQSAFLGVCAANGLEAQEIASISGYTRRTADRKLAVAYEEFGIAHHKYPSGPLHRLAAIAVVGGLAQDIVPAGESFMPTLSVAADGMVSKFFRIYDLDPTTSPFEDYILNVYRFPVSPTRRHIGDVRLSFRIQRLLSALGNGKTIGEYVEEEKVSASSVRCLLRDARIKLGSLSTTHAIAQVLVHDLLSGEATWTGKGGLKPRAVAVDRLAYTDLTRGKPYVKRGRQGRPPTS